MDEGLTKEQLQQQIDFYKERYKQGFDLESFLAEHSETALPAAIFSCILFLSCVALTLFASRIDRNSRD